MKQVIMSKENANLAIAIPLYTREEVLDYVDAYSIELVFSHDKPAAYAIDIGKEFCDVFGAEFVESQVEFLSEL